MRIQKGMVNGTIDREVIARLIDKTGLTFEQLSDKLNVDPITIRNWKRRSKSKALVAYALKGLIATLPITSFIPLLL